ncbi:MAG: hypothetical protein ACLGIO_14520 [Acidimicrobiia bacterium]
MTATRETARPGAKGLPTLAAELWQLVVAYAKQETVVPVKGLTRFVAIGLAGSALLSIGLLLLVLALLRALQTETGTTFDGNWSWAPYLVTLAACLVVAGLAARAVTAHKRRAERKGTLR